jgi:hypothetical protein
MGLLVDIYRSDYDSDLNAFHGKKWVTVVNVDGPFDPTPDAPAARLVHRATFPPYLVPDDGWNDNDGPTMYGGTLADSSDSRWNAATGHRAVHIHDRRESWPLYDLMSR